MILPIFPSHKRPFPLIAFMLYLYRNVLSAGSISLLLDFP